MKVLYIYIYDIYAYRMTYYTGLRNDEMMQFAATWMKLENIKLSKISQKQKGKN